MAEIAIKPVLNYIIDWVQEFDKCDKKTAIAKCKSFVEIFQVLPNKQITKPNTMKPNQNL